ncbi:MAG: exopolysaccharide biosynthesis protein [Pseudomonadota bacterium]
MTTTETEKLTLLGAIEAMAAEAPDEGLTLHEITDRLDERAFGALLFVLALPVSIPFLYGVPQVVAVPMLALVAQMVLGRAEPWLPASLARRTVEKSGLEQMARGSRKWFGWLERFARPRLTFLASAPAERIIGLFLMAFCCSILIPLPATNTMPGIAVAIVSFGLLARDGLLILPGLLLGSAWITGLILVGDRLTDVIRTFVSNLF